MPQGGLREISPTMAQVSSLSLAHWEFSLADGHAGVVKLDPYLAPFSDALKRRYSRAQEWINKINHNEGGVEKFSRVRPPSPGPYDAFADNSRLGS